MTMLRNSDNTVSAMENNIEICRFQLSQLNWKYRLCEPFQSKFPFQGYLPSEEECRLFAEHYREMLIN